MTTKRTLARAAGVVLVAMLALVGTAGTASAGRNSAKSHASNGDGWARFIADGDYFEIRDTQCDGGTVWAQLQWYKSGHGWNYRTIHNTSGCNTTDKKRPWNDIPEDAVVFVEACGGMADGYSNTGKGKLSRGSDCDLTQGGQDGEA